MNWTVPVTRFVVIYVMRSLMICTPHPIFSGDEIEKNEMGGTCSAYGGKKRRILGFGRET